MTIELDDTGQDWRAYLSLEKKRGSPKRNSEVSTGLWRLESGQLYATPVETAFNEFGVMVVTFPVRAPFLDGAPDEIDPDCGDVWHKFQTSIWPKLKAVPYDEYEEAKKTGRWADGQATQKRDAMGGNMPPDEAVEQLLAEAKKTIEEAKALAAKGKAKSQDEADAAAILTKKLTTQKTAIEDAHRIEKKPILEDGRKIDEKFLRLRDAVAAAANDVKRKVNDPFLLEQEEIAKRAREAAEAAAQKVIDDANKAAREAAQEESASKGETVTDEQWEAAAPAAPAVTIDTPKVSAGVKGARATLREVRFGKVEDYEAFALALAKSRNRDLVEVLNSIADKMARLSTDRKDGEIIYPGVKLMITRRS